MRNCSDQEWAKFHPPDIGTQKILDYIKGLVPDRKSNQEAFLCMDLNEDNSVVRPNYYSGLTIAYIPCDKVADYDLTSGSYEQDAECIADKAAQIAYLGDLDKWDYYQTFLYYNYEFFDAEQYGEDSIQKISKISEFYFDPTIPKWFDFDY